MFKNLRYRFAIFMQGRYGTDQLSRFLSLVVIVLIVFDWIANAFLAFPGVRVFVHFSGIIYARIAFCHLFPHFFPEHSQTIRGESEVPLPWPAGSPPFSADSTARAPDSA